MKSSLLTYVGLVLSILSLNLPAAAGDLNQTLGVVRRVQFLKRGPEWAPLSYGRPIETAVPEKLMLPLQMANEGLTFYAAYGAKNYPAMAAVGAMSLWGGTLRKGIDAVAAPSSTVSVTDLQNLTDREIAILGYLWQADGRSGSDLYRDLGSEGTWTELSEELGKLKKRQLIRKTRSGLHDLYRAEVAPTDVRRAVIATGDPERITQLILAIGGKPYADSPNELSQTFTK